MKDERATATTTNITTTITTTITTSSSSSVFIGGSQTRLKGSYRHLLYRSLYRIMALNHVRTVLSVVNKQTKHDFRFP